MTKKYNDIRDIDLADFKEPSNARKMAYPLCPARWVLHSKAGMCRNCPLRLPQWAHCDDCGLSLRTIDHPYRVVDKKDGKTRHFIAYPYSTGIKDMEAIIALCKAHPGLRAEILHVGEKRGRSYRLDFYYDASLAKEAAK